MCYNNFTIAAFFFQTSAESNHYSSRSGPLINDSELRHLTPVKVEVEDIVVLSIVSRPRQGCCKEVADERDNLLR